MKIVLSILICISAFSFAINAQQNRFVFVQADSRQPFNITINKKVYSSTASGYVIVPKMLAGKYSMAVGFGGNTMPDQYFNIEVAQKDLGYTLKKMDQKGWVLFNIQSFETTYAGTSMQDKASTAANTTDILIKPSVNSPPRTFQPEVNIPATTNNLQQVNTVAADQPGNNIVNHKVAAKEGKVDTVTKEIVILSTPKETIKEPSTATEKNVEKTQPIQKSDQYKSKTNNKSFPARSRITKISELKGGEAIYITYVDELTLQNDTISVLIPDNKIQVLKDDNPADKKEIKFLEISLPKSKDTEQLVAKPKADEKLTQDNVNNNSMFSTCVNSATNDDFLKLRKKMASATDTDGMISEAKKSFKVMCFNTQQIKNLAYLFLTDQARYQFFDASYPFASDATNFHSLSIMLSETYYVNRFKAMLIN